MLTLFLLFFTFEDVDIRRMDGEMRGFLWEHVHKRNHIRLASRTKVPTSEKAVFLVFVLTKKAHGFRHALLLYFP